MGDFFLGLVLGSIGGGTVVFFTMAVLMAGRDR